MILQAAGEAGPSLARDLLLAEYERGMTPEMEDRIKWTTGMLCSLFVNVWTANLVIRVYVSWYALAPYIRDLR